MRVSVSIALERLADYIETFLELSGKERWFAGVINVKYEVVDSFARLMEIVK